MVAGDEESPFRDGAGNLTDLPGPSRTQPENEPNLLQLLRRETRWQTSLSNLPSS